jgi:hypothetical protein
MSLVRLLWKSRWGLAWCCLAIISAVYLSLCVWHGVPHRVHASGGLAVRSLPSHYYRQCFERDDFQWSKFSCVTLVVPPPAESVHVLLSAASYIETMTDGWHYNRPPPVG